MLLSKPEGLFEIGYGIFRYFILLLRLRFYGREEDAFDWLSVGNAIYVTPSYYPDNYDVLVGEED